MMSSHRYETLFHRHDANPILTAADWPYPVHTVFNPAATRLPDGTTLLLCRVEDRRGHSHLCAGRSRNGVDGWTIDAVNRPAKLSYRESRELELLPQQIETLEAEQQALHARMADAGYHQLGREALKVDRERLLELERELARSYERWAELDARIPVAR